MLRRRGGGGRLRLRLVEQRLHVRQRRVVVAVRFDNDTYGVAQSFEPTLREYGLIGQGQQALPQHQQVSH